MGTWGKGLYDNDSALDALSDLVKPDDGASDAVSLIAQIGLLAWFHPSGLIDRGEDLGKKVNALDLSSLPGATREALAALLDDPEAATATGSRSAAVTAIVGGYNDGPRIDALVRLPGAETATAKLAESAAGRLDQALAQATALDDITGAMAALGVLLELAQAGLWQPASSRVARWRKDFSEINQATKEQRSFWVKYARHVQDGFNLLSPQTAPPPVVRQPRKPGIKRPGASKPPAPAPERYSHPKLGTGVLVGRTGGGPGEILVVRFGDGVNRKFHPGVLTRLDD